MSKNMNRGKKPMKKILSIITNLHTDWHLET